METESSALFPTTISEVEPIDVDEHYNENVILRQQREREEHIAKQGELRKSDASFDDISTSLSSWRLKRRLTIEDRQSSRDYDIDYSAAPPTGNVTQQMSTSSSSYHGDDRAAQTNTNSRVDDMNTTPSIGHDDMTNGAPSNGYGDFMSTTPDTNLSDSFRTIQCDDQTKEEPDMVPICEQTLDQERNVSTISADHDENPVTFGNEYSEEISSDHINDDREPLVDNGGEAAGRWQYTEDVEEKNTWKDEERREAVDQMESLSNDSEQQPSKTETVMVSYPETMMEDENHNDTGNREATLATNNVCADMPHPSGDAQVQRMNPRSSQNLVKENIEKLMKSDSRHVMPSSLPRELSRDEGLSSRTIGDLRQTFERTSGSSTSSARPTSVQRSAQEDEDRRKSMERKRALWSQNVQSSTGFTSPTMLATPPGDDKRKQKAMQWESKIREAQTGPQLSGRPRPIAIPGGGSESSSVKGLMHRYGDN